METYKIPTQTRI